MHFHNQSVRPNRHSRPPRGFTPQGLFQAVPTDTGPSLYSVQAATGAIQTLVQAFTSDGQQLWQTALNSSCAGFSAPDGNGGVLADLTGVFCTSGSEREFHSGGTLVCQRRGTSRNRS